MTLGLNNTAISVDDRLVEVMELNLYNRLYSDPALDVPITIRLDIEETIDKLCSVVEPKRDMIDK